MGKSPAGWGAFPLAARAFHLAVETTTVPAGAFVEPFLTLAVEMLLDGIEVRGGTEQRPPVTHQAHHDHDKHPHRPELAAVGVREQPDRGADDEQRERTAGLLDQAPGQVRAPGGVAEGDLAGVVGRSRRSASSSPVVRAA